MDASGTALRAVVLVVWRVKDTARAALGVADHEGYLRDQVEAALARVLSQLPADAFLEETTRTLRDAEAVGDALTRMLKADCAPAGIEIYSAQPTVIEYAPEVAAAMQRCRVAAIDAKHRDGVLTSVVDAVDDTVGKLTARHRRARHLRTQGPGQGSDGGLLHRPQRRGRGLTASARTGRRAETRPTLVWTCSWRVNNLDLV